MNPNSATESLEQVRVHQFVVRVTEPADEAEGFEPFVDRFMATWDAVQGWWTVSGDNWGSHTIIVHPYQVAGFMRLFGAMADANEPGPSGGVRMIGQDGPTISDSENAPQPKVAVHIDEHKPPQLRVCPPHAWAWAYLAAGGTAQVCRICGVER